MKYISTRGKSPELNFCDVLLGGLAPDGGLYLPKSYPKFTKNDLNLMRSMSYQDLAFSIFEKSIFISSTPFEASSKVSPFNLSNILIMVNLYSY